MRHNLELRSMVCNATYNTMSDIIHSCLVVGTQDASCCQGRPAAPTRHRVRTVLAGGHGLAVTWRGDACVSPSLCDLELKIHVIVECAVEQYSIV